MNNKILIPAIVAIFSLAIGFWGGTIYQKSKVLNNFSNMRVRQGQSVTNSNSLNQRNPSQRGKFPLSGKIINQDASSLTLQTVDGSNKIITLSQQTIVNKNQEASLADLKTGVEITVFGTSEPSGSITAKTISIGIANPIPSPTPTIVK